jgi:DNA invertase Pin-like site-specific DNA recombinase
VQLDQLETAGCTKVFAEKRSGRKAIDREQLTTALGYVRDGDVFVVTRLDRLARSVTDLRNTIDQFEAKVVGFRVLQQEIDTTTSSGRLMLNMLAAFAEFENDLRRERQRDGIEKAKVAGVYKGRPPMIDVQGRTQPSEQRAGRHHNRKHAEDWSSERLSRTCQRVTGFHRLLHRPVRPGL